MNEDQEELPSRRVAGVEYLSCEYCGEPVSQLGTRTPRRYCKRSHRQRAYELRARQAEVEAAVEEAKRQVSGQPRRPVLPQVDPAFLRSVSQRPDPPAARPAVVPVTEESAPVRRPRPRPGTSGFPTLWDSEG